MTYAGRWAFPCTKATMSRRLFSFLCEEHEGCPWKVYPPCANMACMEKSILARENGAVRVSTCATQTLESLSHSAIPTVRILHINEQTKEFSQGDFHPRIPQPIRKLRKAGMAQDGSLAPLDSSRLFACSIGSLFHLFLKYLFNAPLLWKDTPLKLQAAAGLFWQ